jgi:hypothetical protein
MRSLLLFVLLVAFASGCCCPTGSYSASLSEPACEECRPAYTPGYWRPCFPAYRPISSAYSP